MRDALLVLNILVSISIVVLILMQGKGAGLGGAWGGSGEMFHTRRGVEKLTMRLTIILIGVFFTISAISLFIK